MNANYHHLSSPLPRHLKDLPASDNNWGLWRCVGLRGSGFPAKDILKLAADQATEAADDLLSREAARIQACEKAMEAVNGALDDLRGRGLWDDQTLRKPLMKALWALKDDLLPPFTGVAALDEATAVLDAANKALDEAKATYDATHGSEVARQSAAIREITRSDLFCEAVIWQNRHAYEYAIRPLREKPESMKAKARRQREWLVAMYYQRYCAKNDTIGFFGPVGWADLADEGPAIRFEHGPNFLAERNVYFEQWGIDVLATILNQEESLRPWMVPLRIPTFFVEGGSLHRPFRLPMPLSPEMEAVLDLCDGTKMAEQMASILLADPILTLKRPADVYGILSTLESKKLITWSFNIPLHPFPEQLLRQRLEKIEPEAIRCKALEPLNKLEAAREKVVEAAGRPKRLDKAIKGLEASFTEITGEAATTNSGKTYGGRTLVYEDCRRDTQLDIGPEMLENLGSPLSLVLTSFRWFTYQVSVQIREKCQKVYEQLVEKHGTTAIDMPIFSADFQPVLFQSLQVVREIENEFYRRWSQILGECSGKRPIQFKSEALKPLVDSLFAAPDAGWPTARYQCPDVMISAVNQEAIAKGDYQLVLGEIHIAFNTLASSLWENQHPDREALINAIESDFPELILTQTVPKNWPNIAGRVYRHIYPSNTYFMSFSNDHFNAPASRTLPIGSLVVEKNGDDLEVRTRDNQLHFDLLIALTDILSHFYMRGMSFDLATINGDYSPQLIIDDLVVSRETWQFEAETISFAFVKEDSERFLAARRWALENNIPRFAFVRVPTETKPLYVDFNSLVYVDIFAKKIRQAVESNAKKPIKVVEMLPSLEQTWLDDNEGNHYTSEFRFIAVDTSTPSDD